MTRILGELRKVGIQSISRNTVKAILKRNGYDIGPKRGPGTWDEFLKRHAKNLWQCDFFSKKIVSKMGLQDIFVLVFLNQTIQQECLDHFLVFGHKLMDVLCREFKDYYHLERPHPGTR